MKILFFSDTHGKHFMLKGMPDADIIICGGDFTMHGLFGEVKDFLDWFSVLPYKHKIFIAGNHDFYLEINGLYNVHLPSNIHYLVNSGVFIDGVFIYGSPVTPYFHNWAFNEKRGKQIKLFWDMIPENTNILITHGPPFGILDLNSSGYYTGCYDLGETVRRIKPRYHLFGHIHESYGAYKNAETTFFNGCILNEKYKLVNEPILFDY